MKFSVQKEEILPKIQFVNSIVPIRNPLQILTNILFEIDKNENILKLASTDLEVSAVTDVTCNVEEEGNIAVPAKKITEIIRSLPDNEIFFETKDKSLHVKCEHINFDLIYTGTDDFPEMPERDWDDSFQIDANLFSDMVEKTSFAVSEQVGRPAFSGVLWEIDSDTQIMVATDGKRLGKFKTDLSLNVEKNKMIIPIKGLNLVRRIIGDNGEKLDILPEENVISFKYDSYKIFSRLIEANYPDYDAVIPYDNSKFVKMNPQDLKKAVQRISLLASEDTLKVKLIFSEGKLVIHCEDIETGQAEEVLDFEGKIDNFKVGFNYKYLTEILQLIDTEKVLIKFENSLDPALFYRIDEEGKIEEDRLFLLMPLRLSSD
ncbi:MAG: DNA polymerase III subunit beta [Candidatus Cloacimonetes bacterium]|nr:DNA polymerase III subunit beta [Candidatus Cloacimonadota bacterium]